VRDSLTPLDAATAQEKAGGGNERWFVYQERKFTYHEADKQFHKLDFPVAEPFAFYQKAKGHSTESFAAAQDKWGINRYRPTLHSIHSAHAFH
jgi:hypothetical protein